MKKLHLSIILCAPFVFICYLTFYSVWTLKGKASSSFNLREPPRVFSPVGRLDATLKQAHLVSGTMNEQTLQYFLTRGRIERRDAAEISWCHGVNSRSRLVEALSGSAHMLEADVLMREADPKEPIMAHPPDKDSDITLEEWLQEVKEHQKGIKLDFKSLEAVAPSLALLQKVLAQTNLPVWINADVLPGPGGHAQPLDPQAFLSAVGGLPPHTVLSLGWTTGWTAGTRNPGYSWDMVQVMEEVCRPLKHAVSFPVRAALLAQSFSQLHWLLQQSDRYSLTVWTGQSDRLTPQDLLAYQGLDRSRIYYDLPPSLRTQLRDGGQDGPGRLEGSPS